ncbi:hypothetical protein KCU76_g118, partial [Aureobasidium melanogenum]
MQTGRASAQYEARGRGHSRPAQRDSCLHRIEHQRRQGHEAESHYGCSSDMLQAAFQILPSAADIGTNRTSILPSRKHCLQRYILRKRIDEYEIEQLFREQRSCRFDDDRNERHLRSFTSPQVVLEDNADEIAFWLESNNSCIFHSSNPQPLHKIDDITHAIVSSFGTILIHIIALRETKKTLHIIYSSSSISSSSSPTASNSMCTGFQVPLKGNSSCFCKSLYFRPSAAVLSSLTAVDFDAAPIRTNDIARSIRDIQLIDAIVVDGAERNKRSRFQVIVFVGHLFVLVVIWAGAAAAGARVGQGTVCGSRQRSLSSRRASAIAGQRKYVAWACLPR